jgi:hypothetical protein
MYLIEIKALSRNSTPLVVALPEKSDKFDHRNIAPGGDLTGPPGNIDLQVFCHRGDWGTSNSGNPL